MQDITAAHSRRNLLLFTLGLFCFALSCTSGNDCKPLKGAWSNREGQVLVFQKDNTLLWLTQFGSTFDTVQARYNYDCRQTPNTIDFTDFKSGSFQDKTLYGILEWSSDTTIRLRFDSGLHPSERPKEFDADLTQKFVKM